MWIFLLLLLGLTSCSSVYTIKPNEAKWITITADKRQALVVYQDRIKMCAEPSPDVAVDNTLDLLAEARVKMQGGELNAKLTSEIVQLAGRTQVILFLRESLYRLCEQSLNGNIPPQVVANMFERIMFASLQLSQAQLIAETNKLTPESLDAIKTILPQEQLELPFNE